MKIGATTTWTPPARRRGSQYERERVIRSVVPTLGDRQRQIVVQVDDAEALRQRDMLGVGRR